MKTPTDTGAAPTLRSLFTQSLAAFGGVAVFSMFINLLMLTIPLYMLQIFDHVLASRSTETLLVLTGIAAFALLIYCVLEAARSRVMLSVGMWIDQRLGNPLLIGSIQKSLQGRGSQSAQSLRDLSTFRSFVTGPSILPLLDFPWTPIFVGLVFVLHPMLGWLCIGGSLLLVALGIMNELMTSGSAERSHAKAMRTYAVAESAVRNADTVEGMGMTPAMVDRWTHDHAAATDEQARSSGTTSVISAISKTLRFALQIGVLAIGAWLAINGEATPGVMIAASILMTRALAPVEQTIGAYRMLVSAWNAGLRLHKDLKTTPDRRAVMALPQPSGEVEVEDIYYAHPNVSAPLLRAVSFAISPGESIGIIGPSGSGKTTLARLLIGNLRPSHGSVRLDKANMADWNPDDRGQHVGYLPQTVELFAGSVRENIARMTPGTPESIFKAASVAGAHEVILRLPQGYETDVLDGGVNLSGGERQRIAIARALYGDPRFVILDEPSTNLDTGGEEALLTVMRSLRERKVTTVIISHRPSLLREVDRIVVLNAGQIVLLGPAAEVMQRLVPSEAPRHAATA